MNSKKNRSFLRYCADKLLKDLRKGVIPDDNVLEGFLNFHMVNALNSLVREGDKDIIIKFCKSSSVVQRRFGISISRGIHNDPEIKEVLAKMWNPSEDFSVRSQLLWFLLDYPDQSDKMREEIYEFIQQNFDDWLADRASYGGRNQMLDICKMRLEDNFFPRSKIFAYLCVALASPNRGEVKDLLKRYRNSSDSLTRRVANDMLKRITLGGK